jgi:hypothetical protein
MNRENKDYSLDYRNLKYYTNVINNSYDEICSGDYRISVKSNYTNAFYYLFGIGKDLKKKYLETIENNIVKNYIEDQYPNIFENLWYDFLKSYIEDFEEKYYNSD